MTLNPDCRDGKHDACNGDAWDFQLDQPSACQCDCHSEEKTMTDTTDPTAEAWRKVIASAVRRNCTPSSEAYAAAGDTLIYAVADWIENPPEWVVFEAPETALTGEPEIVVLCGSTRFYDEFQQANYDLTMAGKIVLSVGFYPHAKARHGHGEGVGHDSAEKVALDGLHKRKIDLADRVLVLNVGGYIGKSTRGEIEYALAQSKPIDYLEGARQVLGTTDA